MNAQVSSNIRATTGGPSSPELSLDALSQRSFHALETLYGEARCAKTMRAIDGTPKGRMLAVRLIDATPLADPIRAFARSKAFVWDGKTFTSSSDTQGAGINRVVIPGALGRQNLFPFHTLFGASRVDGRPALILDYDLAENPPWIRRIHDEVREASPGLFFGPAMWLGKSGATTVLWFALDTRGR